MNTATLSPPSPVDQRLSLFWVLLWFAIGSAVTTLIDFDWTQDIAAYAENLEAQPDYDPESLKGAWYQYLVFPLMGQLGSADQTLAALKGIIFSLFFLSQRKSFQTNLDCLLFVVVLLLTPALSQNMTEYLRQGTALGVLMLGLSFSRRIFSIPLVALALFTHLSVVLPVLAVLCAWFVRFAEGDKRTIYSIVTPIFCTGGALIFGLLGGDIIRTLAPEGAEEYLSGSRTNLLGLLYLGALAGYAGLRYSVLRSKAHLPVFIAFLAITASYSVLLNFGRTISIVLPLHLAAALTLPNWRSRLVDLAAVFVGGTAFVFASGGE